MIVGTAAHPFRPFEEWLRVARLVEELGYGMTCQSQNPVLRGDPFVELGVAARETRSVLLATTVAVAGLVNPAVQAAAVATVDEISHGRAVLGLGRGAATAAAIGEPTLSSAGLEAYVLALRDLLGGRTVTWRGAELRLPWVTRPVPVILSAYGPRTLQLAGRCADGVLIASAVSGPVLADAIRSVRESAAAAGRAPGDVAIWVTARAAVGTDRDEALADLKAILAGSGRQLDRRAQGPLRRSRSRRTGWCERSADRAARAGRLPRRPVRNHRHGRRVPGPVPGDRRSRRRLRLSQRSDAQRGTHDRGHGRAGRGPLRRARRGGFHGRMNHCTPRTRAVDCRHNCMHIFHLGRLGRDWF
jgi:alkanesulfonate monooxygenase SsuD/methylene tetrahydromethanopterin reductase-like flavin-dependent oxidoreductase (luciferase family)